MTDTPTVADRLADDACAVVLGVDRLPVRLRAWDGSPRPAPTAPPRSPSTPPQAVRRLVWAPGELGLARAYVAG